MGPMSENTGTAPQTTSTFLDGIKEIVSVLAVVALFITFIAQTFYVPSGSMEPTLKIGDALIAAKYPYGYSRYSVPFGIGLASQTRLFGHLPRQGDVTIFRLPRDHSQTYVKRVIGLPGDRIQMIAGRLWINGKELPLKAAGTGPDEDESGAKIPTMKFIETLPDGVKHPIFKMGWNGPMDNTPLFVVPPGHLFMMGDNRDNSEDSRVSAADGGVGYVPVENLMGRAEIIIGSYDFLNTHGILSWPGALRLSRFLHLVH
jgi:signal peptidase I